MLHQVQIIESQRFPTIISLPFACITLALAFLLEGDSQMIADAFQGPKCPRIQSRNPANIRLQFGRILRPKKTSIALFLVAMPFAASSVLAPRASLLLVVRPGAP